MADYTPPLWPPHSIPSVPSPDIQWMYWDAKETLGRKDGHKYKLSHNIALQVHRGDCAREIKMSNLTLTFYSVSITFPACLEIISAADIYCNCRENRWGRKILLVRMWQKHIVKQESLILHYSMVLLYALPGNSGPGLRRLQATWDVFAMICSFAVHS